MGEKEEDVEEEGGRGGRGKGRGGQGEGQGKEQGEGQGKERENNRERGGERERERERLLPSKDLGVLEFPVSKSCVVFIIKQKVVYLRPLIVAGQMSLFHCMIFFPHSYFKIEVSRQTFQIPPFLLCVSSPCYGHYS